MIVGLAKSLQRGNDCMLENSPFHSFHFLDSASVHSARYFPRSACPSNLSKHVPAGYFWVGGSLYKVCSGHCPPVLDVPSPRTIHFVTTTANNNFETLPYSMRKSVGQCWQCRRLDDVQPSFLRFLARSSLRATSASMSSFWNVFRAWRSGTCAQTWKV